MRIPYLLLFLSQTLGAQSYTSYFSGDTSDVHPQPQGGICLMGGATEDDNAMRWFLERASGGDVVVIRTSGADGYNDYMYSDLGVAVNSVETILMPNAVAALDPYVVKQIRNAEALWIAGGDQTKYVNYWKDKPVEAALLYLIHEKNAVIGGTSAGMAILSEAYFRAANGTVTSAEALSNPFNAKVDLGFGDFLVCPVLKNTITDTHYDNPDRRGRHVAFLARLTQTTGARYRGIACEEYTAVCIDTTGMGRVFGTNNEQDYAYFLQVNCTQPYAPENCVSGMPLHWVRGNEALKVCKIKGTSNGANTFDLRDWHSNTGGTWQDWWTENGVLKTSDASTFTGCVSAVTAAEWTSQVLIYPNPSDGHLWINLPDTHEISRLQIFDWSGKLLAKWDTRNLASQVSLDLSTYPSGFYWVCVQGAKQSVTQKVILH